MNMQHGYVMIISHGLLLYCIVSTGWPIKVSQHQMIKKVYYIVVNHVNEIRFIRKIKV